MINKKFNKCNFINNDSLIELKSLRKNAINTVILDPPYYRVVDEYWDKDWATIEDYLKWTEDYVSELSRVTKESGTIWLFGFAYQLTRLIPIFESNGFKFKQFIVLDKGLKSIAGRSSDKLKQFPTATEYIAFFYKESRPKIRDELQRHYLNEGLNAKIVNEHLGKASNGGGTWSSIAGIRQKSLQFPTKRDWELLKEIMPDFKWKYEDYVYTFNTINGFTDVWSDINFYIKNRIHPTEKPQELLERIILTATNKNDVILDPFAGSGSTGICSNKLNRRSILIEKDSEIFTRAVERMKNEK